MRRDPSMREERTKANDFDKLSDQDDDVDSQVGRASLDVPLFQKRKGAQDSETAITFSEKTNREIARLLAVQAEKVNKTYHKVKPKQ